MADSLLNEVDADVRAERLNQLWLRYRFTLLFAVIAIILATAGATLWQNYQEKRGGELLLQFTHAQKLYAKNDFAGAADAFAGLAKTTNGDVSTLAQLWEGRALVKDARTDEATAVFKTAAARNDGIWADIACLRLASVDIDAATCLTSKQESPLANSRHEWHAANLWAAGKKDEAVALLEQLQTSADTSDATRATTAQWLATMRAAPAAK